MVWKEDLEISMCSHKKGYGTLPSILMYSGNRRGLILESHQICPQRVNKAGTSDGASMDCNEKADARKSVVGLKENEVMFILVVC